MPALPGPRLSVVIVTYNERELIERCLPPLLEQLAEADELIVADNASADGSLEAAARLAPGAVTIAVPKNDGYMPACNAAVRRAQGDLIVLLDTDAVVAPGFCEAIRRPFSDGRAWDAWMGLLTMDSGRLINTSGGVVHFTGISWAGQVGEAVAGASTKAHEVGFLTGACMAIRRSTWERHPGFADQYFLYFDDVDYSLRVRLAGGRLGIEPSARADHLYDFTKRRVKWRLLERNRWATILRTYPWELLTLLAPALVLTEVGLLLVALRGGWLREKLAASWDTARWLPRLLAERRQIQTLRRISAHEFATYLTAELSSPYLGPLAQSRLLAVGLRVYWAAVKRALAPRPAPGRA